MTLRAELSHLRPNKAEYREVDRNGEPLRKFHCWHSGRSPRSCAASIQYCNFTLSRPLNLECALSHKEHIYLLQQNFLPFPYSRRSLSALQRPLNSSVVLLADTCTDCPILKTLPPAWSVWLFWDHCPKRLDSRPLKGHTTARVPSMGQNISKLLNRVFGSKEMRLLMLGLDAAGKTSKSFPEHSTRPTPTLMSICYVH